jgi:hypothetical protein
MVSMTERASLVSLRIACASAGLSQKSGCAASDSSSATRRFLPATSKMPPELGQRGAEPVELGADALEVAFVYCHGAMGPCPIYERGAAALIRRIDTSGPASAPTGTG